MFKKSVNVWRSEKKKKIIYNIPVNQKLLTKNLSRLLYAYHERHPSHAYLTN